MTLAGALRELSNDRFHCPSCGQQYVCKHAYLVILFLAPIMATAVSSLISMVVVHATIQCEDCANWSDIVVQVQYFSDTRVFRAVESTARVQRLRGSPRRT